MPSPDALSGDQSPQTEIYAKTSPEGDVATISSVTLDEAAILASVKDVKAGGLCCFVGTTRDTFKDKQVSHLSYTSYAPLALRTILSILSFTRTLHPSLRHLTVHHRIGSVPPGETSIVIAVASPHRREAFEACEWVLEEVKRKVQVWKREVYTDGGVLDEAADGARPEGGVEGRSDGKKEGGDGVWKENFPGGKWDEEEYEGRKDLGKKGEGQ